MTTKHNDIAMTSHMLLTKHGSGWTRQDMKVAMLQGRKLMVKRHGKNTYLVRYVHSFPDSDSRVVHLAGRQGREGRESNPSAPQ